VQFTLGQLFIFWFRARGLVADLPQWAAWPEARLINDHLEGGPPESGEKLQRAVNHECRPLLMPALPHLRTRRLLSDGINPHIFLPPNGAAKPLAPLLSGRKSIALGINQKPIYQQVCRPFSRRFISCWLATVGD